MAEFFTYGELRARVEEETDTEEETFVEPDEKVRYANKGINIVEAEILKVDEDYFLEDSTITFVAAQEEYAFPAQIYANKIRGFIYHNGTQIFPIKRFKRRRKFERIERAREFGTGNLDFEYFIRNKKGTLLTDPPDRKIVIVPAPAVAGAFGKLYWIRNANRVPLVTGGTQAASDATIIDILEWVSVVEAYMKMKIMDKEGDPRFEAAVAQFQAERQRMIETLTDMVPDDDNEIEQDLSHYHEAMHHGYFD